MFGHNMNVGQYDLYFMVQWFCLICERPFDIWAATSENRSSGFPTRSHTTQAAPPQKMARGLKFYI